MAESADIKGSRQYSVAPENPLESVESAILNAVRSIRYGSVEIVIQDSKVVQMERKDRFRFDK
jgi:hypothetical protein